jgi:phosphohistidine phosphatase
MGLLLVRHSDAAQAVGQVDDSARWLTASGRSKARAVAELLKNRGISFTRMVTSPRVRAVQTAEIFAQTLNFAGAVVSLPSLSYTVPADLAARDLAGLDGHIAAFGHMPTLGDIAQLLTGGSAVALAPSEAVWIEGGRLLWAIDPVEAKVALEAGGSTREPR